MEGKLRREFPGLSSENTYILFSPTKQATGADIRAEVTRIAGAVQRVKKVTLLPRDREDATFASDLVSDTLLPLHVEGTRGEVETIDKGLLGALGIGQDHQRYVRTYLVGEGALWVGLQKTIKQDLAKSEFVGFPLLLLVLIVIFGSLGAAVLPILLGIGTVIVTGAAIYLLSTVMQLSLFVTNTASLIGIGVAIDYSLIILARVRQELAVRDDLLAIQRIALLTSGRAVVFSGVTVVLSLCGLWLIPGTTLRSMAVGAALAVCIAVAMSVTMLPALIWTFGARRVGSSVYHGYLYKASRRAGIKWFSWRQWTAAITRHPLLITIGATACLLVLAIPTLHIRTSTGALRLLNEHDETRVGFEKAARINGAGALGPIYVVASGGGLATDERDLEDLRGSIESMSSVKEIHRTHSSYDKRSAMFAVIPAQDPEAPAIKRLVSRLRGLAAANSHATKLSVEIGGATAIQIDQENQITQNLWKVILAILSLSVVILTLLLRSVFLPLKAIVMNLLAVSAAYGVLVAVFQWGWADAVLGFHSHGYLETLTPPMVLAIVFGLSMDYEIFLLSRITEHWEATGDAKGAVAAGLSASARTISSAALMLVCVFAVFVGTGVTSIKEIGLGGAVAIGLDVTFIRLVLVPALMTVLGRWNWWWPRVLARVLPSNTYAAPESVQDGIESGTVVDQAGAAV